MPPSARAENGGHHLAEPSVTYQAIEELGRVVRMIFIATTWRRPELRREIHEASESVTPPGPEERHSN